MNKLKKFKENVKGFTLVEIIVVLLILAILAAIAIPSMLGYVNEAKNSEYIAEARTGYVAAQTVATRATANAGGTLDETSKATVLTDVNNVAKVNKYIGADSRVKGITVVAADLSATGKITKIIVNIDDKKNITIENGKEPIVADK